MGFDAGVSKTSPSFSNLKSGNKDDAKFRIGVIFTGYHALFCGFMSSFIVTLQHLMPSQFTLSTHPTGHLLKDIRTSTHSYLDQREFDLILSLGIRCTLVTYDLTRHQKKPTPLIFTGIRREKAFDLELIRSLKSSGNHLTGILLSEPPFRFQLETLTQIKTSLKNILVIYNSCSRLLESDIEALEQACNTYNLTLDTFEINHYKNYKQSLGTHLENADLALTLRDSMTLAEMETIAQVCKEYNTDLCPSDWYSVDQGATMGFGFNEEVLGVEAAYTASMILKQGLHPSHIPSKPLPFAYLLRLT